jgi:hypothetical protein
MRWLLFIARVTLVCNICYLVFVLGRYVDLSTLHHVLTSTIVTLGLIAVVLNIIMNLIWLFTVLAKKKYIPFWLGVVNFLFLVFEIVNIIILQL